MAIAPFVAYILFIGANMDFYRTFQLFTFFGVSLILMYASKKNTIRFPKYLFFYLLFVLYVYYSAFFQLDRKFELKYLFSNKFVGAFNMMFIIENITFSKKYFKRILKVSKYVLIIAFIVLLIQQVINKNFFVRPDLASKFATDVSSEDRLDSIYSWLNPNSIGYGFVPIFIIIAEILSKQKKKLLYWMLFGLIFAIISKARWVMINALMVLFLLIINQKNKFNKALKYAFLVPLIAIGTYVMLNSVGIDAKGIVEDRILEKNNKASHQSASTRLLAFKVFDKLYWKNALFGVGNRKYGMGSSQKSVHNYELRKALGGASSQIHVGFLMLFYMYGLIGGGFFVTFIVLILLKLYKDAKFTTYWGPFLGFLGFAISNLTLVNFSVFEMGLLVSLFANKYYVNRHKNHMRLSTN